MKSNVEFLKDRLIDLLSREEPFVITINGEWGIGKTHFWNNFKENHLKNKKVSYVSLFGKDKLEDIRTDIIFQISKKDEYINKSRGFFSNIKSNFGLKDEEINFGLTGSILSSLLTLFTKKDFEDVIVCFDDFERLSKHLDEKDILGLISELKEQKNSKVIMILNQDKVVEDTLSNYKDKIIDYELHYLPTSKETYSLVEDQLKGFKEYPLNYFIKHDINNIRVMRRVINSLNDFYFVEKLVENYKSIEKEIVENILELSTINSISTFKDFKKMSKYHLNKSMRKSSSNHNQNFELNEEYENILKYIDTGYSYFYLTDMTNYMIEYIKTSIVDKEPLLKMIEEKKSVENRELVNREVRKLYYKFNFNMKYKVNSFVHDIFEVFEKNHLNIVDILNSNSFIFYINLLKELDSENEEKYHKFGVDRLKLNIDKYIIKSHDIWGFEKDNFIEIQRFDKSLEEYVLKTSGHMIDKRITNIKETIKLMTNPMINNSWGEEPDLLDLIDKETLKKYVLENQDFLDTSFDFIRKFGRGTGSGFKPFIDKLISVFEEFKNSDNIDHKIKMTKLLDFLNK